MTGTRQVSDIYQRSHLVLFVLLFAFYSAASGASLSDLLTQCSWKAKISVGYNPVNDSVPEVQDTLKYMYTQYGSQGINVFCPLVNIYSQLLIFLFAHRRCYNNDPFCNTTLAPTSLKLPTCTAYQCYKTRGAKCKTLEGLYGTCLTTVCPFVCFYFPQGPLTATQAQTLYSKANQYTQVWWLTKRKRLNQRSARLLDLLNKLTAKRGSSSQMTGGGAKRQNLSTSCPYCGCFPDDVPCTTCAVNPGGTPCWHNGRCCQCVGLY